MGTVVKAKLGKLEDKVRELFSSFLRKELNGVVQVVSGKTMLSARFQDRCEEDMTSNQLTTVIVERSSVTEEANETMIYVIPDENIYLERGYYHGVYVLIQFNKGVGVGREEDQADMESDPDEEEMEDVRLDNKR